jgi:hypothetical protein
MAQWVIAATDAVNMDNVERTTGIRDSTEIAAHQADWWLFLTDKDPVPDRHTIGQEKRCSILQSDRSRVPRPKNYLPNCRVESYNCWSQTWFTIITGATGVDDDIAL